MVCLNKFDLSHCQMLSEGEIDVSKKPHQTLCYGNGWHDLAGSESDGPNVRITQWGFAVGVMQRVSLGELNGAFWPQKILNRGMFWSLFWVCCLKSHFLCLLSHRKCKVFTCTHISELLGALIKILQMLSLGMGLNIFISFCRSRH